MFCRSVVFECECCSCFAVAWCLNASAVHVLPYRGV